MSFKVDKVYTENPYVDEMVYYTKQIAMGTVLKMQDEADKNETLESLKNAELYIACIEGTAIVEIFPSISTSALNSAGIIDEEKVNYYKLNPNKLPENKKALVVKVLSDEYINNYEELNTYYRMLHGLPAVGKADYITDWIPPEGTAIDVSKPIHEMSNAESLILDSYGVLDRMIEEDPANRQYMRFLGKKKIDYYLARKANKFDALYIPTIDSESIDKMYRDKLDENKFYVLRTVYSEAFKYNSDYYDNFIAVFIILITMVDIVSRVQEFIARKEIFDIRSVQYIFKSYGVPFFEEIPLKYQIAMVKNLHTLLKYKSTSKCMVDICSLFGFKNIKIFKYYLLKDRTIDLTTGDFIYAVDEEGNEDLEKEYELKFLKLPLEEDLDDYVRIAGNYIDYDEITTSDPKWDGGLDHNDVMKEILKQEFNFSRTKYMSIDTIYDIAKMSIQQSYFFNFLYDNVELEDLLTIQIPYIEPGKNFKIADIFTLLTILTYYYRGVKDTIMDTQSKVLYVNGFNFKADLGELAAYVNDTGHEEAKEILNKFNIPSTSIPSFNEMMKIYVNNVDVREELIKGMYEAENKRIYDIYQKLYNSLMIVELTFDHYKNPETGDFYRDTEGDATYSEYLKYQDPSLYYIILNVQEFEDEESRNQYIANLIDSIIYALEEFIDTDEFQYLFSNLPVISSEGVKQYISTVINFYKSYKVDFLGMNTIYTLDDKGGEFIKLIEEIFLNYIYHKPDYINIYDLFNKISVSLTHKEKIELFDRIYLDIRTWVNKKYIDHINVSDIIWEKYVEIVMYTIIGMDETLHITNIDKTVNDFVTIFDDYYSNISLIINDSIDITDKVWDKINA